MNPARIDTPSLTTLIALRGRSAPHAALERVTARLEELRGLQRRPPLSDLAAPRARLDEAAKTVSDAALAAGFGRGAVAASRLDYSARSTIPGIPRDPFSLTSIHPGIEQARAAAGLAPGDSIDINVEVRTSAQQAGFYLSFGSDNINLSGATARFSVEIAGNTGVRELSFASGTTIASIEAAINSFAAATGVQARMSGTGIVLKSTDFGDHRFVSVRVIDHGAVNTEQPQAGIYAFDPFDNNAIDWSNGTPNSVLFTAANVSIRDFGQDVEALVNGVQARSNGRSLSAELFGAAIVFTDFRLSIEAAQRHHSFHAFTINREPGGIDVRG